MFFSQINTLRDQFKTVYVAINFLPDGTISLIVNPEVNESALKDNPAMGGQLAVSGSAEALDASFASAFGSYFGARASIAQQAAEQVEQMAKLAKDNKPKAKALPAPVKKAESAVDALALSGEVAESAAKSEESGAPASPADDDFWG